MKAQPSLYTSYVNLIKRMKRVEGEPPSREQGHYLIREYMESRGYGEALALLRNIRKAYIIKREYAGKRKAKGLGQKKSLSLPNLPKKQVQVKENVVQAQEKIHGTVPSAIPSTTAAKKGLKQKAKQKAKARISKGQRQAVTAPAKIPTGVPFQNQPNQGQQGQQVAQITEAPRPKQQLERLIFKKEEGEAEIVKPLLGLHVPQTGEAEALAVKRVEALKGSGKALSLSEMSKQLIILTQQLLREKDAEKRATIREQISHLKEQIKAARSGKQVKTESIEVRLKKLMKDDVDRAVSEVKSALKIYDGLEDRAHVCKETKKAIDAYINYLESLHAAYIKQAGIKAANLSQFIDYSLLNEIVEECRKGSKESKEGTAERTEGEAGRSLKKEEEESKQGESEKSSVDVIKKRLASMREAQLLHELSVRDRDSFLSYIRGELPKTDALKKAKLLIVQDMGKKMGLSAAEVEKLKEEVLQ